MSRNRSCQAGRARPRCIAAACGSGPPSAGGGFIRGAAAPPPAQEWSSVAAPPRCGPASAPLALCDADGAGVIPARAAGPQRPSPGPYASGTAVDPRVREGGPRATLRPPAQAQPGGRRRGKRAAIVGGTVPRAAIRSGEGAAPDRNYA
ncbi:hypothetical protein GCM10027440_35180 [Nocardiopsis coralliicola]